MARSQRPGHSGGLVVSRGLAETMGGSVHPEETPGGGLTMVVSLTAAATRLAAEAADQKCAA